MASHRSKSAIVGVSVWLSLSLVSVLTGGWPQGKLVFFSAVVLAVSCLIGMAVGKIVTETRQRRRKK